VSNVNCLETTLTNESCFHEEIKSRRNSGNAIIIVKCVLRTVFYVVLYGCETWSLSIRVYYSFVVSKERVLKRISGCYKESGTGG
jgi:hypothetical protein